MRGDGDPLRLPLGSPGAGARLPPPWGTGGLGLPAAERSQVGVASHARRLARASCQMLPRPGPAQPARRGGSRGRCLSLNIPLRTHVKQGFVLRPSWPPQLRWRREGELTTARGGLLLGSPGVMGQVSQHSHRHHAVFLSVSVSSCCKPEVEK